MSLEQIGVWQVGVWATTVWADGVWREGDAPEPEVAADVPGSGGIWYELERIRARRFKRKIEDEKREQETKDLKSTDREIAKLLREAMNEAGE
jgi:hypothetical protein